MPQLGSLEEDKNLPEVLEGDKNLQEVLEGDENLPEVLEGDKNLPEVLQGDKNLPEVLQEDKVNSCCTCFLLLMAFYFVQQMMVAVAQSFSRLLLCFVLHQCGFLMTSEEQGKLVAVALGLLKEYRKKYIFKMHCPFFTIAHS